MEKNSDWYCEETREYYKNQNPTIYHEGKQYAENLSDKILFVSQVPKDDSPISMDYRTYAWWSGVYDVLQQRQLDYKEKIPKIHMRWVNYTQDDGEGLKNGICIPGSGYHILFPKNLGGLYGIFWNDTVNCYKVCLSEAIKWVEKALDLKHQAGEIELIWK